MKQWWLSSALARRLTAFALLLTLLALTQACEESRAERAEKTASRVVSLCTRGERTLSALHGAELVTSDEADRIVRHIRSVRSAASDVAEAARALRAEEADAEGRLRSALTSLVGAAERLESEGLLRVRNEQARARLRKVLTAARLGVELGL